MESAFCKLQKVIESKRKYIRMSWQEVNQENPVIIADPTISTLNSIKTKNDEQPKWEIDNFSNAIYNDTGCKHSYYLFRKQKVDTKDINGNFMFKKKMMMTYVQEIEIWLNNCFSLQLRKPIGNKHTRSEMPKPNARKSR